MASEELRKKLKTSMQIKQLNDMKAAQQLNNLLLMSQMQNLQAKNKQNLMNDNNTNQLLQALIQQENAKLQELEYLKAQMNVTAKNEEFLKNPALNPQKVLEAKNNLASQANLTSDLLNQIVMQRQGQINQSNQYFSSLLQPNSVNNQMDKLAF